MGLARRPRETVEGRTALVTGGARGIGLATARALAGAGARVTIGDLDAGLAAEAAAGIAGDAEGLALDVTDHAAFTAVIEDVERRRGPLDVLVNNAGVMPVGPFEDETPDDAQRAFDVNVFALMHGTREAIRRMRPRGRGHVVNVASMAGVTVTPGAATYASSKYAVVGLCEALRWELRGSGVHLTCVLPAMVNTELAGGIRRSAVASTVEPETVAAAILEAVRRPRDLVYVPRFMGPVTRWSALSPRAVGDWFTVRLGADRLLTDSLGTPERARYAERVRASAPGAERRRSG